MEGLGKAIGDAWAATLVIAALVTFAVTSAIGAVAVYYTYGKGVEAGRAQMWQEAIDAHVALRVMDSETGKVTIEWVDCTTGGVD